MADNKLLQNDYYLNREKLTNIKVLADSETREDAPVVKLLDQIIIQALQKQASDIHIEPQEDRLRIRIRVDGCLYNLLELPKTMNLPLISRIKVMAGMDIAEKRKPLDGRIKLPLNDRKVDLRISTLPAAYGEKVVIRILEHSLLHVGVEQLGVNRQDQLCLKKLIKNDHGLIIFTGPTGSGKSTSLYAVLQEINGIDKNIVTVEDPIEYLVPGINQMAVNLKAGLSFSQCLRAVLRQDPDIIMVGEIRDEETATMAIRAALTGHLVLTTLHTNDAAGAIVRLLDMGIKPYLLASALTAVIGQRLVRVICPQCCEKYQLAQDAAAVSLCRFLQVPPEQELTLYRGTGCSSCGNSGFKGRTGLFEILPVSNKIRTLIKNQAAAGDITKQAQSEGMRTIYQEGINKVLQGVTTAAELRGLVSENDRAE